jgi:hypothetical protein
MPPSSANATSMRLLPPLDRCLWGLRDTARISQPPDAIRAAKVSGLMRVGCAYFAFQTHCHAWCASGSGSTTSICHRKTFRRCTADTTAATGTGAVRRRQRHGLRPRAVPWQDRQRSGKQCRVAAPLPGTSGTKPPKTQASSPDVLGMKPTRGGTTCRERAHITTLVRTGTVDVAACASRVRESPGVDGEPDQRAEPPAIVDSACDTLKCPPPRGGS